MTKEITIRESSKEFLRYQMHILWQFSKGILLLGAVIGVIVLVVNCFFEEMVFMEGLKYGLKMLLIVLAVAVGSCVLVGVLFLVSNLFMLPRLLNPREYRLGCKNGRFFMEKSGNTMIDVPQKDVSPQFVNIKVNGISANKVLIIHYKGDDGLKKINIDLTRIPDKEKGLLRSFVMELDGENKAVIL